MTDHFDLAKFSYHELTVEKERASAERGRLRDQITRANADARLRGVFMDRNAYAKLQAACRAAGLRIQAIDHELSRKKREQRQAEEEKRPLSEYFIAAARRMLPRHEYLRIMDAACAERRDDDESESQAGDGEP